MYAKHVLSFTVTRLVVAVDFEIIDVVAGAIDFVVVVSVDVFFVVVAFTELS